MLAVEQADHEGGNLAVPGRSAAMSGHGAAAGLEGMHPGRGLSGMRVLNRSPVWVLEDAPLRDMVDTESGGCWRASASGYVCE